MKIRRVLCWITGHDYHLTRIKTGNFGEFVDLAQCTQCNDQWWMRGEIGQFRGVRFVRTVEVEDDEF